jgi:hypothetical protein
MKSNMPTYSGNKHTGGKKRELELPWLLHVEKHNNGGELHSHTCKL